MTEARRLQPDRDCQLPDDIIVQEAEEMELEMEVTDMPIPTPNNQFIHLFNNEDSGNPLEDPTFEHDGTYRICTGVTTHSYIVLIIHMMQSFYYSL